MNICIKCNRIFVSHKALKSHYQRQKECNQHFLEYALKQQTNNEANQVATAIATNIDTYDNDAIDEEQNSLASEQNNLETDNYTSNNAVIDQSLKSLHYNHVVSGFEGLIESNSLIQSQVDLLVILKQAKAPLYLFDQIWKWTQQSAQVYNVDYSMAQNVTRKNCIKNIKNCFNLNGLDPIKKKIKLKGSGVEIDLVTHSFSHCLYSLLNDKMLMDQSNLLFSIDFANTAKNKINKKPIINDIDTGSVYQKAMDTYINANNNEILCPIIFFIDKTHTDVQGRLCLEQIRFTLGIFNRQTRSNPNAWRTLGYIADQSYIKTKNSFEKNQDYHHMISEILSEYKEYQGKLIEWDLTSESELSNTITVYFKLFVLLIIGDTDGHDKLAGRYTSRNGIKKPCRYCNISFEETDEPEVKFVYNKHSLINIRNNTASSDYLQSLSIHGIDNAWEDILFCDNERGLYGALCADILHCLQHGLFNYALQALFDRKAAKNATTNNNEINNLQFSNKNVFTQNYSKHFDEITKKYGFYLSHQSDRELPRTHINTNYTTITRKNANEMSGILIAILIIFLTDEGTDKLDDTMAGVQAANFIHLFELLLMLENFCSSPEHKITDVKKFKKFVPFILNTYKKIINCETGCGCKFIKFHLPNHFADDMLRFGSMLNFDTEIGESHHKTEAKYPSQNTQRRKSEFEFQTATRQIENFAINKAFAFLANNDDINVNTSNDENENTRNTSYNSWYRYRYDPDKGKGLQQKTANKKWKKCQWIDQIFQNQLVEICKMVYTNGCIDGKLRFFSLHSRQSCLLRADPNYQEQICWYDWVEVNWSNENIPTKLLLFWNIIEGTLKKPFKIGQTTITEAGCYVLCYSLLSKKELLPAHSTSVLVQYGKLAVENDSKQKGKGDKAQIPKLFICHIDCIASTMSAVPYKVSDGNHNAIEWLFLQQKAEWYKTFMTLMKNELEKEKMATNSNREALTKKQRKY